MTRCYDYTFEVQAATGMLASGYLGTVGKGVLMVDGGLSDFESPEGRLFSVTCTVSRAQDMDGRQLDGKDRSRFDFGPELYRYQAGRPFALNGTGWRGTLVLRPDATFTNLTAELNLSGTGLARLAVKDVRITMQGVLRL